MIGDDRTLLPSAGTGSIPHPAPTSPATARKAIPWMPTYAADAIRESLTPLTWTRRMSRPGTQRLSRAALATVATIHRLRSRVR